MSWAPSYNDPLTTCTDQFTADGACGPGGIDDILALAEPGWTIGEFTAHCAANPQDSQYIPLWGGWVLFMYAVIDPFLRANLLAMMQVTALGCFLFLMESDRHEGNGYPKSRSALSQAQWDSITSRRADLINEIPAMHPTYQRFLRTRCADYLTPAELTAAGG